MAELNDYLQQNAERFEQDLCEWLKIASVSTDPAFEPEVQKAAKWLADKFNATGIPAEIIPTCGHPIVYAESPAVEGAPTVLVYGHYDVQPPDPLDLWDSPPFEPVIKDRKVYARGATDDKGQMLTHLLSVEAWKNTKGDLPVQIKFLIEGEEECGGAGLKEFLSGGNAKYPDFKSKLAADIVVISDTSQYGPGQPAITYGLRGICYFQLNLNGPNRDLHSGSFGGTVTNPANALATMLSQLIDNEGRIQIPGFYDDVVELTDRERQQFADLKLDDAAYASELGVAELTGESGFTTLERRWARPTFDINGLWSGYQGEGAKTVLPAEAGAKFSCRIVPNQDPRQIFAALEKFLQDICPPGIEMELVDMHGAPGCLVDLDSPYMTAAARAVASGFGIEPVFTRAGGSIPVVTSFKELLGIDTLLLGWGQDDDNPHSPNEKFSLDDFHLGIKSSAHLWEELAKIN